LTLTQSSFLVLRLSGEEEGKRLLYFDYFILIKFAQWEKSCYVTLARL